MFFLSGLILKYYNYVHFLTLLMPVGMALALYFALKNKSEKIKDRVLYIVFGANAIIFLSYKAYMGFNYESFEILNELPLHLCNLNVILLPIALVTKNKFLFSYLYYVGTLGALAAFLFFDTTFLDRSLTDYGVFIYFFYHGILLAAGIVIPAVKIYTPAIKDILKAHGTLIVLSTFMHLVNTLFRFTGLYAAANYFYTYGMPGNPLLDALMNLVKVPLLYFFPVLPVVAVINFLMYLPFLRRTREMRKTAVSAAEAS